MATAKTAAKTNAKKTTEKNYFSFVVMKSIKVYNKIASI